MTTDGELWEIYSDLSAVRSDGKEEVKTPPKMEIDFKVCQRMQKASACLSQKSGWEKDKEKARKVLEVSHKYAEGKSVIVIIKQNL